MRRRLRQVSLCVLVAIPCLLIAAPATAAAANPTLATIAAVKNSAVIASLELATFLSRKILNVRGVATAGCSASGPTNDLTVPVSGVTVEFDQNGRCVGCR